jgi:hypothetical protein
MVNETVPLPLVEDVQPVPDVISERGDFMGDGIPRTAGGYPYEPWSGPITQTPQAQINPACLTASNNERNTRSTPRHHQPHRHRRKAKPGETVNITVTAYLGTEPQSNATQASLEAMEAGYQRVQVSPQRNPFTVTPTVTVERSGREIETWSGYRPDKLAWLKTEIAATAKEAKPKTRVLDDIQQRAATRANSQPGIEPARRARKNR